MKTVLFVLSLCVCVFSQYNVVEDLTNASVLPWSAFANVAPISDYSWSQFVGLVLGTCGNQSGTQLSTTTYSRTSVVGMLETRPLVATSGVNVSFSWCTSAASGSLSLFVYVKTTSSFYGSKSSLGSWTLLQVFGNSSVNTWNPVTVTLPVQFWSNSVSFRWTGMF